jgi:hypothetical protein
MFKLKFTALLLSAAFCQTLLAGDTEFLNYAKDRVASATSIADRWDGPTEGPLAEPSKK